MPHPRPKERDIDRVVASTTLSERQSRILSFIRHYTTAKSHPPSLREIAEGCNISSTSVVNYNIRSLEESGYLTRTPMTSRTIVLIERGKSEAAS